MQILFNEYEVIYIDMVLTFLHKAAYGDGGLSGDLWAMEWGTINVYYQIWRERLISLPVLLSLLLISLAKFLRRIIRSKL
ncbi:unnamed protein product [marine sediment metagenome]|uniref:Uncharacterized protein n=1 Tax=marine sediment metagenome TaxID=412755 RepID=X1GGB5_9ZZZZ